MMRFVFFWTFFFLSLSLWAQKSKKALENEKNNTLQEIQQTQKILEETEDEKVVSMGQLAALSKQIEARQSLIRSINREIASLASAIEEVDLIIKSLEMDLINLKKEYASMVYVTYKANRGFNNLTFLFSANTFHQFFMRLKYMEQYSRARKNQVTEIKKVQSMLQAQLADIASKNQEKQKLKEQQLQEQKKLLKTRDQHDKMVAQLTKKENELRADLKSKRKAINKLDAMIASLVAKEMEEARKNSANEAKVTAFKYASTSFKDNQNKLLWPVSNGFISGKFGIHPHPILKGINEKNDGINIQTNRNEKVFTVFDGKVTKVAIAPPPFHNLVIVQHGEYFTVYAKLSKVMVKSGQSVKAKEVIGEVYTDKNGVSEVHFMVWKNNQKLDPEKWLVRK